MVYVDDLLVLGDPTVVDKTFEAIQQRVLLKHIGYIGPQQPQQILGRIIKNNGDRITMALADSYINNIIEEASLKNCNLVATPGIAHYKPTVEDAALLDKEQHKRYRRVAGKLQWPAYTRPDIAYSTKELARDRVVPTELPNKRVKHLLRYLQGTKRYKFIIQPTTTLNSDTNNCLDLETYVDADWAGCPTRKSTSGFNTKRLNATIAGGSRTQLQLLSAQQNQSSTQFALE